MKVISLSALTPQSGKDTLADYIQEVHHNLNIKRIAFGDALRNEVVSLFKGRDTTFHEKELRKMVLNSAKDIDHPAFAINKLSTTSASSHCICTFNRTYRNFLGDMFKNDPVELTASRSLRFHLQHYGNNFTKDHLGKDMKWIDFVWEQLAHWEDNGDVDLVIITDVRDPKEFDLLVDLYDALSILVKTDGFPVSNRTPHPIEEHAKHFNYDHVFVNEFGNKQHLKTQYDVAIKDYINSPFN